MNARCSTCFKFPPKICKTTGADHETAFENRLVLDGNVICANDTPPPYGQAWRIHEHYRDFVDGYN